LEDFTTAIHFPFCEINFHISAINISLGEFSLKIYFITIPSIMNVVLISTQTISSPILINQKFSQVNLKFKSLIFFRSHKITSSTYGNTFNEFKVSHSLVNYAHELWLWTLLFTYVFSWIGCHAKELCLFLNIFIIRVTHQARVVFNPVYCKMLTFMSRSTRKRRETN
jgi:hypothetical protein